jgi:spermidine synthase
VDTVVAAIVLAALATAFLLKEVPRTFLYPGDSVLLDTDTPYHHITVIESGDSRELRFDQFVETAIKTSPPYESVATYTHYFHLAFLAKPDIERSLFIGAGGGVGPRTFGTHAKAMEIDVVDIDPKVLESARTLFFLEPSPKIRTFAEDGRMFLRRTQSQYDCIVLDAFTVGGRIPFHLATREFFSLCRTRMKDNAVFVMNINSAIEGPNAGIFGSMYRTLESVFEHTYVFAKDYEGRGDRDTLNVMLLATQGIPSIQSTEWTTRAELYHSDSYVDTDLMKRAVAVLLAELPDLPWAPLFTDDYAPIETMSF